MAQDYEEGKVYELLTKEIFNLVNIELEIFDYKDFPEKQNEGIDAEIKTPSEIAQVSLQIKMFQNTEKYGTFPWEVSRFLEEKKDFVIEPHNADFHIIIDPIDLGNNVKLVFWVIETSNIPDYYRALWEEALKLYGSPSEKNSNWEKVQGKTEPYFRLYYKNETLYQLKLRYTAYQRNVRYFLVKLEKFHKFSIEIPKQMLKDIESNKYDRNKYFAKIINNCNEDIKKLKDYFKERK